MAGCIHGAQVQICHGDGLSPAALNAHLAAFHEALTAGLTRRGLKLGTPLFIRRSRVKVMDQIAQLLDAQACVFTCGERPGLGFADSMSAYYIYRPHGKTGGATDADREVISNINPRGLPPVQAAEAVAEACVRILAAKKSGVSYGIGESAACEAISSCRVCGYPSLDEPPIDPTGSPTYSMCPSCGTQFGADDVERTHDELRAAWVAGGCVWWSEHQPPPEGWSAAEQLKAAGLPAAPADGGGHGPPN